MAMGNSLRKVVFLLLLFIYVITDLNLQVYCKGSQSGKDLEPNKNDDFSEFDQEEESEPVEDDNEFGYVTTPDQENSQSQGEVMLRINALLVWRYQATLRLCYLGEIMPMFCKERKFNRPTYMKLCSVWEAYIYFNI